MLELGNNPRMRYWLMKSEPSECSVDEALRAPGGVTPWSGVRNYQARNFMRDAMRPGDGVLFYHSGGGAPGIAGIAEVASAPYPDETQFLRGGPYFDPKATRERPRWFNVDVRALQRIELIPLAVLRAQRPLAKMWLLRRGSRLSITPVSAAEWRFITRRLVYGGAGKAPSAPTGRGPAPLRLPTR